MTGGTVAKITTVTTTATKPVRAFAARARWVARRVRADKWREAGRHRRRLQRFGTAHTVTTSEIAGRLGCRRRTIEAAVPVSCCPARVTCSRGRTVRSSPAPWGDRSSAPLVQRDENAAGNYHAAGQPGSPPVKCRSPELSCRSISLTRRRFIQSGRDDTSLPQRIRSCWAEPHHHTGSRGGGPRQPASSGTGTFGASPSPDIVYHSSASPPRHTGSSAYECRRVVSPVKTRRNMHLFTDGVVNADVEGA